MSEKKWAIGVDLGGTKIEVAMMDQEGSIQHKLRAKTVVEKGYKAVERQIESMVEELLQEVQYGIPIGIGVGAPGQVESETGTVKFAPNLQWTDVPLGRLLRERLDLPVLVINDVRAATWGEWFYGAGKGCSDMICMFVGTGIGGGIICNGKMLEGAGNSAGEIGHMTIQLDGPECHCGNKGCLEALVGSWAIARDAQQAVKQDTEAGTLLLQLANGEVGGIKAKTVTEAYKQGDNLARRLIGQVTNALAGGLMGLANALNPQCIVLGGGVIEHLPELVLLVESEVQKRALQAAAESLRVVPAHLHDDSGVIGAASQVLLREVEADQEA